MSQVTKLIKKLITATANILWDFLVPESLRIGKILKLEPSVMRDLLPNSPVRSKNILVLFDYQNKIVRLIVKSIKYKNNWSLRKRIAIFLYEEIVEISSEISLFSGKTPILLPIPMSKKEKRERGFNQCEELCKEIKKLDNNIEISYHALKKIRETSRQTHLDRRGREKNLKGAMMADGFAVRHRPIIILDDVFTTGASFNEARRALLAAGAYSVYGVFIAH